jgi:cysteine desulfurase/selenocysteine lyase
MPLPVQRAMRHFEQHDRANIHRGVHTLSQRATDAFEQAARARSSASSARVPRTSWSSPRAPPTRSTWWRRACRPPGPRPAASSPGDEIIVSGLEHHANLVPWQQAARRCGAELRILRPDAQGRLHVEDLARAADAAHPGVGRHRLRQRHRRAPAVRSLAGAGRQAGALTVLDAAQSVGHAVPALSALDCDFMAFSGHKMYGPMGIGALVGRRSALERLEPLRLRRRHGGLGQLPPRASFAELPMRLEGGTPNVAGAVGLAAAAGSSTAQGARIDAARARAARACRGRPGGAARRHGAGAARHAARPWCPSSAEGVHPHDIGTLLDERGIAVRTGHHCAQPLLDHLGLGPTTRASFALYNTHATKSSACSPAWRAR